MKSKILGCLFGGAIGDALGLPFEQIPLTHLKKLYPNTLVNDFIDSEPYDVRPAIKAGSVSDDTEMTLATAESIIKNSAIIVKDIADNLAGWYLRKLPWLQGSREQRNIGNTTSQALERYLKGRSYKKSGLPRTSCGTAIRISPVALALFENSEKMSSAIFAVSQITHKNPRKPLAEEGALCISASIQHILSGDSLLSLPEYLLSVVKTKEFRQQIKKLEIGLSENWDDRKAIGEFGCGATALATEVVVLAIFSFLRFSENFQKAVLSAANFRSKEGCDTDCIASLAGTLAGCYLGIDKIPVHWREKVEYGDKLESLSQDLFRLISSSNGMVGFKE